MSAQPLQRRVVIKTDVDFISAGLASFTHAEPELVKAGSQPWALSPIEGKTPVHEFVTQDPITKKVGGFWMMALSNEAIVRRSAGLLEQAHSDERYGPLFDYSEFMETPSLLSARILSFTAAVGTWIFQHSSLVRRFSFTRAQSRHSSTLILRFQFRSLLTRFGPQPGTGPTELDKGCFFRVTTSAIGLKEDGSQVSVKSVMFGDGDPGYRATSWMIAECKARLLCASRSCRRPRTSTLIRLSCSFSRPPPCPHSSRISSYARSEGRTPHAGDGHGRAPRQAFSRHQAVHLLPGGGRGRSRVIQRIV